MDIKKILLQETKEKPVVIEDNYKLTAQMTTRNTLQNYLSLLYEENDRKTLEDDNISNIFIKGIKAIFLNTDLTNFEEVTIDYKVRSKLENGWIIYGHFDYTKHTNFEDRESHLIKLTKYYAIEKLLENPTNHVYNKEIQVLGWLEQEKYKEDNPPTLCLDMFAKDAKVLDIQESYEKIVIPRRDHENLRKELIETTNLLQTYIESGELPPICEDLWPRVDNTGKTIPMKCAVYCDHGKAGNCPYYNPDTKEIIKQKKKNKKK